MQDEFSNNMLRQGTCFRLEESRRRAAITTWAEEAGMVTWFNDIDTGVRAVGENMFVNQPMNGS
jgi:hypothetical protein